MQRRHEIAVQTGHFSPELFYGVKISAQEPWLYFVWYFFLAGLAGFISGVAWTPIAVSLFGTFYSSISQSYVLNPEGELFRTGSQIVTAIAIYLSFIVGIYRSTLRGHKEHYLLPTLRFEGDEYTQIPFIIDHSSIQNMDQLIPVPGWHVFKVAMSIPYSGYVKNLQLRHKIANATRFRSYSTYQPVDYGFIVTEGDQSQTFRYHEGRVPYYKLLLECPLTLPCGLTVYYGKQYEKDKKPVPVMFAHDTPYSVELVKKMASIGGLKYEDIKSLDAAIDHHTALDKDYRIEEMENEMVRMKVQGQAEIQQKDQEIADILKAHGLATSDTPLGGDLNRRLMSRTGIIGILVFVGAIALIVELARAGILK
jgi:hypothetical protein